MLLFTILVESNEKTFFNLSKKKFKTWRTGTSQGEMGQLVG